MNKKITRVAGLFRKSTNSVLSEIDSRLSSIEAMVDENIDDIRLLLTRRGEKCDQKLASELCDLIGTHGQLRSLLDTFDK